MLESLGHVTPGHPVQTIVVVVTSELVLSFSLRSCSCSCCDFRAVVVVQSTELLLLFRLRSSCCCCSDYEAVECSELLLLAETNSRLLSHSRKILPLLIVVYLYI